jgi:hypothetical protein
LEFYARFPAIYASKFKRDQVIKDENYNGESIKEDKTKQWVQGGIGNTLLWT